MDLTQLRTFVTVTQEGHLTRAAERLHISQPAASAHIRALEQELGVELFERTHRGLEPTAAGRALAVRAQKVLDASVDVSTYARSLQDSVAGALHIGSNADPELSRIGVFAQALRERHPLISLTVRSHSSSATLQDIRNGELDAGFVLGEPIGGAMTCRVLREVNYRMAAPAAWRDRVLSAGWEDLARLPWILTSANNAYARMLGRLFGDRGFTLNRAAESDNDLVIRSMITAGVGLSLVRDDLATAEGAGQHWCISPLAVAQTHLMFVQLTDRQADPLMLALSGAVDSAWQ
ncbi:LysR family transcriptional regulator [soil metagenome]